MRRGTVLLLVVALAVTACSSDDDDAAPEQSATSSSIDVGRSGDPADGGDDDDEEAPSTTADSGGDEATDPSDDDGAAGGATDPTDEASTPDSQTPPPSDPGQSERALGTWPRSAATANLSSPFAAPAEPQTRARVPDPTKPCQVFGEPGETIVECASGFVSSHDDAVFAVVVAEDGAGKTTTRIYHPDDRGQMIASAEFVGAARKLEATRSRRGDDLIMFEAEASGQYVVGWDAGPAPAVVASTGPARLGGQQMEVVAGRVLDRFVELGAGRISVYEPGTAGSKGTTIQFSPDDPPPVLVALDVYRAWITGDFEAMKGLATAEVIAALQATRTNSDLFVLDGTECAHVSDLAASCTFDSRGQRTTWRLERRDGRVQVVGVR